MLSCTKNRNEGTKMERRTPKPERGYKKGTTIPKTGINKGTFTKAYKTALLCPLDFLLEDTPSMRYIVDFRVEFTLRIWWLFLFSRMIWGKYPKIWRKPGYGWSIFLRLGLCLCTVRLGCLRSILVYLRLRIGFGLFCLRWEIGLVSLAYSFPRPEIWFGLIWLRFPPLWKMGLVFSVLRSPRPGPLSANLRYFWFILIFSVVVIPFETLGLHN